MSEVSRKYEELDKAVSKKIMKELEGQKIDHVCPDCGGIGLYVNGQDCQNCNKTGSVTIQY